MVQRKADERVTMVQGRLTTSHYGTEKGWWRVTNKLTQLPKEGAAWHSHGITWSKGGDSQQPCTAGKDSKQTTARSGRGRRRQSSLQHSCLVPVPERRPTNTCINRNCCNKHTAQDKEQKQAAFTTGQFKEWRDERMIDRAKKTMCIHDTTNTSSIKKTIL